ncbi:MAG: DUF6062 family protein [Herbinix sp.]|nr:DUF6062 family protein [Herbinix sp.]
MKEKLYTIPVHEAFETDCECPVCIMRKKLETNAIEFTMGPSYMEDDIREATSRLGFCEKHLEQLYKNQNRLGLALILKTHMDKIVKDIEKYSASVTKIAGPSFFKKKEECSEVVSYLNALEDNCFVCDKIQGTFERYIATIFHLYHNEEEFRNKFKATKGFCTTHYKILYQEASGHLNGVELNNFLKDLNTLYLDNMKRVRDDLEWFIDKFDYRYADEPWKNSKDALPRSMQKTNSILE